MASFIPDFQIVRSTPGQNHVPGSGIQIRFFYTGTPSGISKWRVKATIDGQVLDERTHKISESGPINLDLQGEDYNYRGRILAITMEILNSNGSAIKEFEKVALYYINIKPSAPDVDSGKGQFICPSNGVGTYTTTLQCDDSAATFYYSESPSATKLRAEQVFTYNFILNSGEQERTLYIWSKNQEFSETYTTVKIIRNRKPTVNLQWDSTSDGLAKLMATPGVDGQSTNNKYSFWYSLNGQHSSKTSLSADTTKTMAHPWTIAAQGNGGYLEPNTEYVVNFYVERHDGIELSSPTAVDAIFTTPKLSVGGTEEEAKNNFNSTLAYFENELFLAADVPDGYSDWRGANFQIQNHFVGFDSLNTGVFTIKNGLQISDGLEVPAEIAGGDLINSIKLFWKEGAETAVSLKFLCPAKRVKSHTPSIINMPNTLKIYTDLSYTIKIEGLENAADYGFTPATKAPNLILYDTKTRKKITGTTSDLIEADTLTFTFSGRDCYDLLKDYEHNKAVSLWVFMPNRYNAYGRYSASVTVNKSCDPFFASAPIFYLKDGSAFRQLAAFGYLKEGAEIYVGCTIHSVEIPTITFSSKAYGTIKKTMTELNAETASVENSNYNAPLTKYTIKPQKLFVLPAFGANTTEQITTIVEASRGSATKTSSSITIQGHWAPRATITSAEMEGTTLKIEYNVDDYGHKVASIKDIGTISLIANDQPYTASKDGANIVKVANFKTVIGDLPYMRLGLALESYLYLNGNSGQLYRDSKEGVPQDFYVFYNSTPTIAYRPNQLGINTTDLNEADLLTIQSYGNGNRVAMKGVNKNGDTHEIFINILDGTISGLVIDCGKW